MACPPQEPNGGIAERRHHWRDVATTHLRAVFIEGHIAYPVRFVLNRPMTSHQCQHTPRCRPLGAQTGEAISQKEYPSSQCRSWTDQNIPLGQLRMAFQAALDRLH